MQWNLFREGIVPVLQGFEITLLATALGSVVAIALGLLVAIARRTPTRWVTLPIRVVTEFVRSTPILVQLLFAWLMLPALEPLWIGVGVLGIHYSTYTAEVYRAGIDAVPKGQWEACTALSLPRRQTWFDVILPQALRNVLPALGNYVISMFKETPFLFAITVPEMVFKAEEFGNNHFAYVEVFTLAGLVFLAASYPTSLLMRKLEKRLGHG